MICQCCKKSEADSKRRPVCKTCYTVLHKEGLLNVFPLLQEDNIREKLAKRYGQNILTDLDNLLANGLQNFGDKYGFTREYARQLFEKVHGYKYTAIKNYRAAKRAESLQAVSALKKDPRYKVNHYKTESNIGKGASSENKVFEICASLGYEIKPYENRIIDLVINDYLVEIKSAYISRHLSDWSKTPHCRFRLLPEQFNADFVVCHMVEKNRFFVIPKSEFSKVKTIYIPINPHNEWKLKYASMETNNHWYQYLESWHLLQPKSKDVIFNNLANRNELSGDDITVREGVQPDSMTSYGESVPCTGADTQAVALTAVWESGSYTNTP